MAALVPTAVAGFAFGLALAAPPGPMNAVIADETVRRGWTAGFFAGLGAMTADALFFVLAVLGAVTVVGENPTVRGVMVAVGGTVMLYFAARAVQAVRTTDPFTKGTAGQARGFHKAFALALTNPYQIVFWLTVGIGLIQPGSLDVLSHTPYVGRSLAGVLVVETGRPALVVGLFGGIAAWIVGFPATLVSIGRRVDAFAPAVAAVSAIVLAGFGVVFLVDALQTLGIP